MKKLFFIMLTMICGLSLHAQVKLQWTTTTPTRFTINNTNSAISANGTTSFGHYGNSTQKLGVSKNGYIEFNVLHPGATGYYDIGFASASNPGSLIVGFHLVDGGSGTIAIGANGTAFNPFAPTGVYYPPCSCYYYESSGTGASCNPGDRLRIERVNNIVRFWNVTTNTELFFLVPTATAFTVAPTSDWTAFFGNSSPTTPVSGVNTASTSFSGLGLNGDDNLWLRTAADAIRPVLLSDKVGIGKEATVELDVQGKTKISALSGTGSMVIEALSTGELVRKRLSTADSVLGGDGNWILKPVSKWQYAATPAGSIYFQPAANPYVGINLNTPAANLDIFNKSCDNLPALKITTDDVSTCMSPFVHGDYIDCKAIVTAGGTTQQRFIVKEDGRVGVNTTPSFYTAGTGIWNAGTPTSQNVRLDVAGLTRSVTFVATSDGKYKTNITTLKHALENVMKLRGVEYNWNTAQYPDKQFDPLKHSGFIAQELLKVLPNSVIRDKEGDYAVDYNSIIPVLTEAIKEQQGSIKELQAQIEKLENIVSRLSAGKTGAGSTDVIDNEMGVGNLAQNVPNPFSTVTEIKYQLPVGTHKALIGVYDMNGKEIRQFQLGDAQSGSVFIQAGDLSAGMYLYSLVVDGKALSTKRMVLTAQ